MPRLTRAETTGASRPRGTGFASPLVVGVISRAAPQQKIPEREQILSAGAVCMNLMVAANALGFASIWLTDWVAYDRAVLARLGDARTIHARIAPGRTLPIS